MAQEFSQKYGLDYDETFSPVVRFESLRTMIALAQFETAPDGRDNRISTWRAARGSIHASA